MRSRTLHSALVAFAEDAAGTLAADRADGAELPYDVVGAGHSSSRGGPTLYCYRPMTGEFILERFDRLRGLDTYLPALRALAALDGLGHYLRAHGRRGVPVDRRSCAELALFVFLSELFEEATDFEVSPERLRRAYGALESTLFAEVSHTTFVAVVRGLEMASSELLLGGGLALVPAEALDDGPGDLLPPGGAPEEASVLVTLSVQASPGESGVIEEARSVLAGLVEALNLFGDACVAIDPAGWMRVDDGPWQVAVLGRPAATRGVLAVAPLQEDELRAFCSLVARRAPRGGELAWALARFRMGCEREHRWEGLSDHLLALRALLEPEGPASGHLPGRLAALCALPEDRAALAERVVDVLALERAVMGGVEPADPGADALMDELGGHLRALLRDVICGHLDSDLQSLADGLITQAAPELDDEDGVADVEGTVAMDAVVDADELGEDEQQLDDEPLDGELVDEDELLDEPLDEEPADEDEPFDEGEAFEEGEAIHEDEPFDEDEAIHEDETIDEGETIDQDETIDERGSDPGSGQLISDDGEEIDEKPAPPPKPRRAKPRRTRKATPPARPRRAPTRPR